VCGRASGATAARDRPPTLAAAAVRADSGGAVAASTRTWASRRAGGGGGAASLACVGWAGWTDAQARKVQARAGGGAGEIWGREREKSSEEPGLSVVHARRAKDKITWPSHHTQASGLGGARWAHVLSRKREQKKRTWPPAGVVGLACRVGRRLAHGHAQAAAVDGVDGFQQGVGQGQAGRAGGGVGGRDEEDGRGHGGPDDV